MSAYQVNQLGAGFIPIGSWYWCHNGANGMPAEPIDSHGPYPFRWLAVLAARSAVA